MNRFTVLIHRGPVARQRRAFTLIELLTVVAIISLLISILLPSLGKARDSAKKVKTQAIMKTIGEGLEAFVHENDSELLGNAYPPSKWGDDPTVATNNTQDKSDLFGAQWLVRYLMGKKLDGYVAKASVPRKYWGAQKYNEQVGWYGAPLVDDADNPWPGPGWPDAPSLAFARSGPYLQPDTVKIKAPKQFPGSKKPLTDTSPQYNNPVLVDTYEMPILYYAANTAQAGSANANIVTEGGCGYQGVYNFGDNSLFSGGCVENICFPPWDFGNGIDKKLEFPDDWVKPTAPVWHTDVPLHTDSFAYYLMNKNVFESTNQKTVLPYRKDSFILISPGKDGQFGTKDDVSNFE